ncbi:MAG TPA: glycosyltransferase [Bacteroidia bacterium]|nr:glycosyltransferase [Bacteroidia bacterium]
MTLLIYIVVGIALSYGIFLLYTGFYFFVPTVKPEHPAKPGKISVVIAFRNEKVHFSECLYALSNIDFNSENAELILVDDHSDDGSRAEAADFCRRHAYARLLLLEAEEQGKKAALHKGIREADGEIIAVTDADCIAGKNWLKVIRERFTDPEKNFLTGPVKFVSHDSFVEKLQASELCVLQALTGGSVKAGFPLFANGANMAFRKKFYEESDGMRDSASASGDDMFLLIEAVKHDPRSVGYLDNVSATVLTWPEKTWKGMLEQRTRWASKTGKYRRPLLTITALLVFLMNASPLLLTLLSLVERDLLVAAVVTWFWKASVDLLLLSLAVPFFKERSLAASAVAGTFIYPFIGIMIVPGIMRRSFTWKGRKWKA